MKPSPTVEETDLFKTFPLGAQDNLISLQHPGPDKDPRHTLFRIKKGRRESELSDTGADLLFEPVSPHPYDLSYACLLIPRFSHHSLSGDVVEYLYGWMYQVCISFSWQLEYIDVQPEHLQWLLNVPAGVPPVHFVRVIRQHTSRQILEQFPRFKKDNLSDDFWAPGHLVVVGKRPHSPEMIREFIRLTRQQQGMSSHRRR